jgi:hypothetical protein
MVIVKIMDIKRLFVEAQKIVPFKRVLPFFVLLFIIGTILIMSIIKESKMPNRDFFMVGLRGQVYEIESRPKDTYFLIGNKWYLIKNKCIDIICEGDSIEKPKDSYMLKVYDIKLKLKWQGEVKSLIFREVDEPK